jgi:hypothetical protein
MQSRKSQARARRRAKLTVMVSRPVDINSVVDTLESEYPPMPFKDRILEFVAEQCGIQYRSSEGPGGQDLHYPAEKQAGLEYSYDARRRVVLTDAVKGNGQHKFSKLRMQQIARATH